MIMWSNTFMVTAMLLNLVQHSCVLPVTDCYAMLYTL